MDETVDERGGHADKLRTIAYPYFVWSAIYFVVATVMAGETTHPLRIIDLWTVVLQPVVHFWFFYCLFSIMMFYGIVSRVGLGPLWVLALSVGIYLLGFVQVAQTHVYALDTLQDIYLPSFALGALVNRGGPIVRLSEAPVWALMALVVGGLAASWAVVGLGAADEPIPALPTMLPGAISLMSLAVLLEKAGGLNALSFVGRHSLAIYVAHVFGVAAMRILLYDGLGVENLWLHFVLETAAGTVLSVVPVRLAEMVGFKYLYSLRGFTWRGRSPHPA